jgi:hypothetical protein
MDWLARLDVPTLSAVVCVGWALSREIHGLGERVMRLETEVHLLLGAHKVVNCASNPKTDVGSTPGPPRT